MQGTADVTKLSFLRKFSLLRFSKPSHDRRLYRTICDQNCRRVVEIGLRDGQRAANMISLLLATESEKPLRYTGIDLFEARPDDRSFTLKQAHRMLSGDGYEMRLVPGEVGQALARCANELRGTDLIVVSSSVDEEALAAAWHFLPRMLHKDSLVWVEREGQRFDVMKPADVRNAVPTASRKRRAA